jgi:iron(III) transport system permease protein
MRRLRGVFVLKVIAGSIAIAMALPLFYLLLRASDVGWAKALELLARPQTLEIISNSIILATLVTLISLVISLPLAWLTVSTDLPGQRWWSVLCALPLVFPSYVGSYSLVAMMGPRGMVQGWLEPFGIVRLPSIYGLVGATWALTIFTYPYLFLTIRAGLRNLDPVLEEAARGLGYDAWRTFFYVTLPNLRPSIISGALLVALYVLSDFGAVSLLRFNSFTRAIYVQYGSSFDRSLASLLALILVFLSLVLLVAAQRMQGVARYHRSGMGSSRRHAPTVLGSWRLPALFFCFTVVMASLILPASVVTYWLVRGLLSGESLVLLVSPLVNSLRAAGVTAIVAAILALPIAYLVVRFPDRYSIGVYNLAYIGNGLPGIVIALSLVFFGANYAPVLYQTLTMLIFAYLVRFLPEAVGTLRSGLLQISPRLEEAARTLGLNRRQAIRRVTIPLLQPGIWAGVALVFLSTIKELPATLLLGPTGFATLATQIWSGTSEAFYTRAAAPALFLLIVSALSIVLILRQEERGIY